MKLAASIKQALQTPHGSANALGRLPDFCNLGIMLRLLIIVNLLLVAAAIVRSDGGKGFSDVFVQMTAFAQPVILTSVLGSCALSPVFSKVSYWQGVSAIFASEALLGAGLWHLLPTLLPFSPRVSAWQPAFLVAFTTAVVLLYFDLRSRALSPALTEARLQALQARIRPHFLFNSINAALSLIRDEPRRAERVLEDMSDLFRVLMSDLREMTTLNNEINLCKQYLEIEQIRLGERLLVHWQIDESLLNTAVPTLLLQPLLENAVYHGIEPLSGPGRLDINVRRDRNHLHVRITNPMQRPVRRSGGNHMAMANIRERLQLYFDAEATMTAEAKGEAYQVDIHLPLRNLEERNLT